MISMLTKEIATFFSSLIAYVVLAAFLTLSGLVVWVFPQSSVLDYGYADLYSFFSLAPYLFLLLAPAVTMRLFSEEKKAGTIELLMARPLSTFALVAGKYLAALVILVLALLPTLLFVYSLSALGSPPGNIDLGATAGSYLGLVLLGSVFLAIGLFSSALNPNQIVAFLLAAMLSFFFFEGLSSLSELPINANLSVLLRELSFSEHYASLSRGLIELRDVFYFLAFSAFFLALTTVKILWQKW